MRRLFDFSHSRSANTLLIEVFIFNYDFVALVFDGLTLTHAVNVMEFGGQDVTAHLRKALLDPAAGSLSFVDAKLIKEKLGFIRNSTDPAGSKDEPSTNFELPDGTEILVSGKALGDSTEALCVNARFNPRGLLAQVFDSLQLCDESITKDLANNIIISGGTSMIRGNDIV